MKSGLGFVLSEQESVETAEIENLQAVERAEIERVHEGSGFGKVESTAVGEDSADELGAEIAVRNIERDPQAAEKKSEKAVGVIVPVLKHIINERFCAGVDFVGDVHTEQSAGNIVLFSVESAVDMFFRESGRQGKCGVFS